MRVFQAGFQQLVEAFASLEVLWNSIEKICRRIITPRFVVFLLHLLTE